MGDKLCCIFYDLSEKNYGTQSNFLPSLMSKFKFSAEFFEDLLFYALSLEIKLRRFKCVF